MMTPSKRITRRSVAAVTGVLLAVALGYLCSLSTTEMQILGIFLMGVAIYFTS